MLVIFVFYVHNHSNCMEQQLCYLSSRLYIVIELAEVNKATDIRNLLTFLSQIKRLHFTIKLF